MSGLLVDGLPVAAVAAARAQLATAPSGSTTTRASSERYWSTPARGAGDPARDVLEVSFGSQRLCNYLSVEVAHFPHVLAVQYKDVDTGAWLPVLRRDSTPAAPAPAMYALRDSVPAVVGSAATPPGQHPQHVGEGHWLPVSFRTRPFLARTVRLLLSRPVPGSTPPVGPTGTQVPYSLGARGLQVGYRINSLADVPRYGDVTTYRDDFASSTDLLGSPVTFSLVQDSPSHVLGGQEGQLWRSEPMPVSFAVVSFYADTRGPDGDGQVIDRWYMEPLTLGPTVNLYWSNDDPSGPAPASDQPLAFPVVQFHGNSATPEHFPPTLTPEHISFSHVFPSYVDVDNAFVQFEPSRPWWLGVELASPYYGADGVSEIPEVGDSHPIVSFGASVLETVPGAVRFTSSTGAVLTVPLDPAHGRGSRWRAVVSWAAGVLTLTYQLGAADPASASATVPAPARPAVVRLGGYPSTVDPGVPGITMRALVLKDVAADPDDVAAFLADPRGYTSRPPFAEDDDGSTDGSILRLDPPRAGEASPAGLFGGPGDPYDTITWTPVLRDYALRRGYLSLPPTKARYWKFEITNLAAEPYEAFVPVRHTVKTFSTQAVQQFTQAGTGAPSGGPGTTGTSRLGPLVPYYGATVLQRPAPTGHSATEALVARTPAEAARVAQYGWVWGFQNLHVGTTAPRFTTVTRHVYETVQVDRVTKVAYFAGLRRLQPYRLDHAATDDPPQYLDNLDDLAHVDADSVSGMVLTDGALVSTSGASEASSTVMASTTPVRAVQFATQQTDPAQVLPDDQLLDVAGFADHWQAYGDADLQPSPGRVLVNRGWRPATYAEVEVLGPTYGDLEAYSYADLEGSTPGGTGGGGLQSTPQATSSGGQVYAAARVSAPAALSAPVVLQVVDADTGEVLAEQSTPAPLAAGEEAMLVAAYGVGTAASRFTYADTEARGTYGDLESLTYGQLESTAVTGDVLVRVLQTAPTSDVFAVTRLSMFDDPIEWSFSPDGGASWYPARGVRNNQSGVLSFPAAGTQLRWRVRCSREGASVSAIAVRPWYQGLGGPVPGRAGSRPSGPNRSPGDDYPDLARDPLWQGWDQPVPRSWYMAVATTAPAQPASEEPPAPANPLLGSYSDIYYDAYGHEPIGPGDVFLPLFTDEYG